MLRKRIKHLFLIALTLTVAACSNRKAGDGVEVKFERFEQLLFETQPDMLQQRLVAEQNRFNTPLLNLAPQDEQYMAMVQGFVSDPVIRDVYSTVDSLYHDLGWLEDELRSYLGRAKGLYPTLTCPKFYTLITADFQDYRNRVFCDGTSLAMSIDRYALPYFGRYQYFGVPLYLVNLCNRQYMAADCMAAIARANIELPDGEMTLLDYMVAEGKTLYFLSQTMSDVDDTILMRYTGEQMNWMKQNESQVWAYLIQNKLLYETDYSQFHNLLDDAPKTNAFGEGSAPRTAAYIGWQIVRRYMKKSGVTMEELFKETDSKKILNESGWRP